MTYIKRFEAKKSEIATYRSSFSEVETEFLKSIFQPYGIELYFEKIESIGFLVNFPKRLKVSVLEKDYSTFQEILEGQDHLNHILKQKDIRPGSQLDEEYNLFSDGERRKAKLVSKLQYLNILIFMLTAVSSFGFYAVVGKNVTSISDFPYLFTFIYTSITFYGARSTAKFILGISSSSTTIASIVFNVASFLFFIHVNWKYLNIF